MIDVIKFLNNHKSNVITNTVFAFVNNDLHVMLNNFTGVISNHDEINDYLINSVNDCLAYDIENN